MNRRIRSSRRQSSNSEEPFLKYLKPGALAQLRDSRINARSNRLNSLPQISLPALTPVDDGQVQISLSDGVPCFAGRSYGPRCPQRKKLVAARSVFYLNSRPGSPVVDSPDSVIDLFNNDILVAH